MEESHDIFKGTNGFTTNRFVIIESLVFHPNGWCIAGEALEGQALTPEFWLEIQKIGWLHFELVVPVYDLIPFCLKNVNNIVMRFEEDCHGETSQRERTP